MQWSKLIKDPLLVEHYDLLNEIGIFEYIDRVRIENQGLENLLTEAYEIFKKESVEELLDYIIKCLSDRFIPADLIFILNQGIMFNRIKVLAYKNLKSIDSGLEITSLEPYEEFFKKYSGTTSFYIFESEIGNSSSVEPFKRFNPEIVVPVLGLSGLYGIILFGRKVLDGEYTNSEIFYINRLMKFTSIGIQNNIHYEHSVKDPKTGLYNHNFFINRLGEETARSRRSSKEFAVLMIDIDHFKEFNDVNGHLAGDEAIMRLAGIIRSTMREEDIISRFGGEEFTILLPDSDEASARAAAERLRTAVEGHKILHHGKFLRITVSIGIALYCCSEVLDEKEMIRRADYALYQSKTGGRNRATLFEP